MFDDPQGLMDNPNSELYHHFLECGTVCTDSRNIIPGSIFFALKGTSFDGNRFASQAINDGAAFAVVDDPACTPDNRYILVPDCLKALQDLASFHRSRFNIPVIAITGTNGKTTTKELIHSVLRQKFKTVATTGNLNNHIGVPLTLLNITDETEIAIIEMGANHEGEIDFLCRIARPGYGIITNIGRAHLEGFGGFEGVVRTKTELYRYLKDNDGTVFLHRQDDLLSRHAEGLKVVTYGTSQVDTVVSLITADPFVRAEIRFPGNQRITVDTKLYGKYNLSNIAAAACIGHFFKVPVDRIGSALESYEPANNRSQVTITRTNRLILDAYNANPSSMEAALVSFAETNYPAKIVILGDMLELGAESDKEHRHILGLIDNLGFTKVFLVGRRFCSTNTHPDFHAFADAALAKLWFEHHRIEQATVLIKGSRGMKMEILVDVL